MDVSEFEYDLPADLIAQQPEGDRDGARLLHLPLGSQEVHHRRVLDLPALLQPGDLLVVNDTRVFPARLLGRRVPSGGAVECLLVGRADPGPGAGKPEREPAPGEEWWEALVHPGQKLKPGARLVFDGPVPIHGEVVERRFFGRRLVRLWTADGSPLGPAVDRAGHVPLPPYIHRADEAADHDRYQTIFASHRGSIAAPTAGLHFSPALVEAIRARGVEIVPVTLHVGYGTFKPVRTSRVEDHHMEPEPYEVSEASARTLNRALESGRRVVAVGTTTTRALESVAREHGGRIVAGRGATDLFIYPGFEFRVIRGLLTNFHLPRSSLLMLVAALAGGERVLAAYAEAVAARYRFYSYGDAMLIL
jgi:S-adenosylmethionine:tRNA ribosyltransferase-isomerase